MMLKETKELLLKGANSAQKAIHHPRREMLMLHINKFWSMYRKT